jgi:hypothetical protein
MDTTQSLLIAVGLFILLKHDEISFNDSAMFAIGSTGYFLTKVRNLRKYEFMYIDNQLFFFSLVVGTLLGLITSVE